MGPALPSGRRLPLRRDGKAAGDRRLARVETGLAPSPAARHCRHAASRLSAGILQLPLAFSHPTSVPYTPWAECVRIVASRTSTFMAGLTAHGQFRYWGKRRG